MSENIITTSVDMKDNAPTPTPEPLVDGNIEDLMENIEEGDIV